MMQRLVQLISAATLALLVTATPAHAGSLTFSGTWSAGAFTASFQVSSTATVNFTWLGGYSDATFSLFDSGGNHLITNDDSMLGGLDPVLTQVLNPGSYTLVASYCCIGYGHVGNNGATVALTDGFNQGVYLIGGTATLASTLAAMAGGVNIFDPSTEFRPYSFTISAEADVLSTTQPTQPVPEPGTWLLIGTGIAVLAGRRLRK